jgi:hypothetical protein
LNLNRSGSNAEKKNACREAAVEIRATVQVRPDVPAEERTSHDLMMRILKLRWMGMESEANRMELALRSADPPCTLLAGPFDTD